MNVSFVQAYTVPRTLPARELPAADPAAAAPSADIALIDLHDAGQRTPAREDHRASELVQPRPRGLIAPEPERPLQSNAQTPCFWFTTYQTAANQLTNGVRVPPKIVPAVTELSDRHSRQR